MVLVFAAKLNCILSTIRTNSDIFYFDFCVKKKDGTISMQNSWHNDRYLFNGPNNIEH